jgi:hypothetical protein
MRSLVMLGTLATVLAIHARPSHANYEGPWCALSWGGGDSSGPHTRSCNQEQEGEADSALASRQYRDVLRWAFFNLKKRAAPGGRRTDMGGLCGRP